MSFFSTIIEGSRQEFRSRGQAPAKRTAAERKVFEVREFVRPSPEENLVLVRHYRTIHHADGRITQEDLSVESHLRYRIGQEDLSVESV